jgi:glycosyltransferase involved in cell wall biosynthesis
MWGLNKLHGVTLEKFTYLILVMVGAYLLWSKSPLLAATYALILTLSPTSVLTAIAKAFLRKTPISRFISRVLGGQSGQVAPSKGKKGSHQSGGRGEFLLTIIIPYTKIDIWSLRLANQIAILDLSDVQVIWVLNSKKDIRDGTRAFTPFRSPNWEILWEPRPGAGVARNKGIAEARGRFLWFVDSDDEITVENWAFLKNELITVPESIDVVLLGAEDIEFGGTVPRRPDWFLPSFVGAGIHHAPEFQTNLFQITNPASWNKIYRSALVKKYGIRFSRTRSMEDLPFTYMCLAAASTFLVLSDRNFYLYHRGNPDSLQSRTFSLSTRISVVCSLGMFLLKTGSFSRLSHSFRGLFLESFRLYRTSREQLKPSVTDLGRSSGHNPSISVIIPMFNSEKYIAATIQSVQKQSRPPSEILVIDDGSTDGSVGIVQQLSSSDPSIRLLTFENGGLSAARNRGILHATSEYLLFLDSDDLLKPNCVESSLGSIIDTGADLVLFDTEAFPDPEFAESDEVRKETRGQADYFNRRIDPVLLTGPDMLTHLLANDSYLVSACLYVFRKETLVNHGISFLEGVIMEDNLFTPQLVASANSAFYTGQILHLRRVRPDSISFRRSADTTTSLIKVLIELNNWISSGRSSSVVEAIRDITSLILSVVMRDFDNLKYQEKVIVLSELGFSSPVEMQEFLTSRLGSLPPS